MPRGGNVKGGGDTRWGEGVTGRASLDLAPKTVRPSGLMLRDGINPQGDIAIEVTGLRPGEKLYEELLIGGDVSETEHPRILRARERTVDWKRLEEELESLDKTMREGAMREGAGAAVDVREMLERWVVGYRK